MGLAVERNLVLTGFMGTGKTTVGRILAERLGLEFVDTDELIESRSGPIHEIFERDGEDAFRALERSVARELAGRTGLVIATGGRMMLDSECEACLEPVSDVVCLTAGSDTIVERVAGPGAVPRPAARRSRRLGPGARTAGRAGRGLREVRLGGHCGPQPRRGGRRGDVAARAITALWR